MTKKTDSATRSSKLNDAALVLSKKRRGKTKLADTHTHDGASPSTQPTDSQPTDPVEISDILTKRYGGISVYAAVMLILAIGIVWTAVLTAEQVQQYHEDYSALQKLRKEQRKLDIENQRLIIEQQTFSATPQIASRAIIELGMYSPTTKDKLILQPTAMPNSINNQLGVDGSANMNLPSNTVNPRLEPLNIPPNGTAITNTPFNNVSAGADYE